MIPRATHRLALRNFTESDFARLHAFASDPEVTRFTSFGPNTPEETKAFLVRAVLELNGTPRRQYSLAVQLLSDGSLIGSCGLGEPSHAQYEIGYVLAKAHWGHGLATEVVGSLVQFAFQELNAKKIWAPVDARNAASCRVLEKAGFQQEGLLRQDRLKWPEGRDTKVFGLLVDEWVRARPHEPRSSA